MSASAQNFVDLDFDEAQLPVPTPAILPWSVAAPGWGHSDGDSTGDVFYELAHAGYSQYYVLEPTPFGASSGPYALGIRSGTFHEQEPRGDFVQAFLSQTGRLGRGVTSVSLFTSSAFFALSLNGQAIDMRPVGLDPESPTYPEDVSTYWGEWSGDVSAFAGQVVDLRITDLLPPDDFSALVVDEIQFLPVSEASTTALFGLGLLTVLFAARRRPERTPHDPNIPMLRSSSATQTTLAPYLSLWRRLDFKACRVTRRESTAVVRRWLRCASQLSRQAWRDAPPADFIRPATPAHAPRLRRSLHFVLAGRQPDASTAQQPIEVRLVHLA